MHQTPKLRRFSIFWAPLVILVVMLVLGPILVALSDLYDTHEAPGFGGLVPEASITGSSVASSANLSVWVDTSPSMYGFLHMARRSCVPPSYKMVLESLPDIAKEYSQVTAVTYYHFDSTFAPAATNDMERSTERAKQQTGTLQLLNENTYQKIPEKGGSSVALPSVLGIIDLSRPTIILTDFEADGLTQLPAEYAQPLERIFSAGYCISVVAMESAFSGVLYNYTNEGKNYSYGTAEYEKSTTPIPGGAKYHHRPRLFYAIIVGTSRQCEQLSAVVQNTYREECQTNIADRIDEISEADDRKERAEDFIAMHSADFWLNDSFDVVTSAGNVALSTIGDAKAMLVPDSPWAANGVPEFSLTGGNGEEAQSATLTFSVVPESACYKTTYSTDLFSTPVPKIWKVVETRLENSALPESDQVLLARGDKRVELSLSAFEDQHEWFSCSTVSAAASGITFQLTVDLSNVSPGMYRLALPVYCRHSTEAENQNGTAWSKGWSISTGRLKETINSKVNTAVKTVDLYEQLEAIRRMEVSQCSCDDNLVAQLMIDLTIK